MPMHDWTRVEAGIFHAFHHRWISAISDVLNTGLLPQDYYALPEQIAAGFGPDVLTLQDQRSEETEPEGGGVATASALQARPETRFVAQTDTVWTPTSSETIWFAPLRKLGASLTELTATVKVCVTL